MSSTPSLTTTYLGHRITIEPAEWGFLISVCGPGSDTRLVAMSPSAMQALERAFDVVDDTVKQEPAFPGRRSA
jgi:hypothetical protein